MAATAFAGELQPPSAVRLFCHYECHQVWHLVAFHDVYTRLNIYRPEPVIPLGFGSMLIQGVIFAWAFPRLFSTAPEHWGKSALQSGLVYAILSWSFTTLAVAAKVVNDLRAGVFRNRNRVYGSAILTGRATDGMGLENSDVARELIAIECLNQIMIS